MKQVVLGTDVRLQFTLDELSDYDITSIKQLRCYVIRKEDIQYIDLDNYGYPQYYSPTDYDLAYTSCMRYNWLPYNQEVYTGGMFGPIDDYRYFPAYNGFGVRSKQFKIVPDKYLAASRVLSDQRKIEMYFPAQDQRNFGQYIVLIVVTLYEPGWGTNNLRTFTINKGIQFELIDALPDSSDNNMSLEYDGYKFEDERVLRLYKSTNLLNTCKVIDIAKKKDGTKIVKNVTIIGGISHVFEQDDYGKADSFLVYKDSEDITSTVTSMGQGVFKFDIDKHFDYKIIFSLIS